MKRLMSAAVEPKQYAGRMYLMVNLGAGSASSSGDGGRGGDGSSSNAATAPQVASCDADVGVPVVTEQAPQQPDAQQV